MGAINNAQFKVAVTSELAGSPLGRPRVGTDFWVRQVIAPVKPSDVVAPSSIYP